MGWEGARGGGALGEASRRICERTSASGGRLYNDKYEINRVTLICPKHSGDVVHRVSIKRGIKTTVAARRRGREAVPF